MSRNAKLGIGLGVSIAVLLTLSCWYFWWWHREYKKQSKRVGLGGEGVEMGGRESGDYDPPPEYSSVVETEVGSLRSERTAVNHVGDEELPHYERNLVRGPMGFG